MTLTFDGVRPSEDMLTAIKKFPAPTELSARAWFGLTNQVTWAYANSNLMAPFRDLVRPNRKFYWDSQLDKLFNTTKDKLIALVKHGVRVYDINRYTCLQTDWCKDGLGYLLLQKFCSCPMEHASVCCSTGWHLVFAGSRFTKGAKCRYAPTEGEALAVTWTLAHSRMFTLGCPNLIISTDHRPLLGIFSDRCLDSISNPRIRRHKEHSLQITFHNQYNPGKWHRGPDALSRYPSHVPADPFICSIFSRTDTSIDAYNVSPEMSLSNLVSLQAVGISSLSQDSPHFITRQDFVKAMEDDQVLQQLMLLISTGFPSSHTALPEAIRPFWSAYDHLWIQDGIVMFKRRLVVPSSLKSRILKTLHSAHQGISGMNSRAQATLYWPRMNHDIRNIRASCTSCN